MKKTKILILGCLAVIAVLIYGMSSGYTVPDTATRLKMKLKKPTGIQQRMIDYNNWIYYMRNDGSYLYRANESVFGGEFPRGSNYSCVYAAGLYVGALKAGAGGDPDTINVANVEFESELLPGKLLVGGEKDLKYRSYVDPNTGDDATKTAPLGELTADGYQSDEYKVYIIDQNQSGDDWDNWPAYAPRRSTGEPMILTGAAAQTYTVFHDLTEEAKFDNNIPALHNPKFGLELELESFVFTAGLLSNGIFLKLTVTNKADHDYRGAYIGIWSDPDVGSSSSDDFASVDTNRGLGIVYSNPSGLGDPAKTALGLDFLQGPVVKVSESTPGLVEKFYNDPLNRYRKVLKFNSETGLLNALDLPSDEFRLGATAFIAYPNPNGEPSNLSGDRTRYWYMAGLDGEGNEKPFGVYDEGPDGRSAADQRIIHGVGPFIMRAGSTQDIWMAFVGAQGIANGAGSGNIYNPQPLSSIQVLQATDDAIQTAFDNALAAPVPPISPVVNAVALDGRVVLTWDNRSEYSFDNFGNLLQVKQPNFNKDYREYDFEGYRIYKSLTGLTGSFNQVAEFDLINGVTTENDTILVNDVEKVLYDVTYGTDNGVQHQYIDTNVINERLYYYAVTAYDYQPLFRFSITGKPAGYPRSLESTLTGKDNLKLVVPMPPPAGFSLDGFGRGQLAKRAGTYSNAAFTTTVVDPTKLTSNKTYYVEMFKLEPVVVGDRILRLDSELNGRMAFRMKDSASGEYVRFDNFRDNPRTYFDSMSTTYPTGDGIYTAGRDSLYDDGYYSLAWNFMTIDGQELPLAAGISMPILNGVQLKLLSDTIGIKDFVEIANGSGTLANPVSVYYRPNSTNKYDIRLISSSGTDTVSGADRFTTARRDMNFYGPTNSISDFEIRFYDTDTAWAYMSTGIGSETGLATASFTRKTRVPFDIWKIGYYDKADATDDVRLGMKFRQVSPTNNLFTMENIIKGDTAYSERISIIDTAYFGNTTNFGAIVPQSRIMATNILIRSLVKPAAYPEAGTVIRVETLRPIQLGDAFIYRQIGNAPYSKSLAKNVFNDVKVVPNPYYGRVHEYQSTLFDKKVKFINLPGQCTIRIFTVAGDLLRTIVHNDRSFNNRVDKDPLNRLKDVSGIDALTTSVEEWDLRNNKGAFVASGMYIALIEAPGVGKKTVKFAVIQEEMRIDGPDNR